MTIDDMIEKLSRMAGIADGMAFVLDGGTMDGLCIISEQIESVIGGLQDLKEELKNEHKPD